MQTNIVWTGTTRLVAALAVALSFAACEKSVVAPTAAPQLSTAAAGNVVIAGTVMGRSDAATMPLIGVSVEATNTTTRRTATTGEDGSFTLDGLSAGQWTIALTRAGYNTFAEVVTIDGDSSMNFELDRADAPDDPRSPQPFRVRR